MNTSTIERAESWQSIPNGVTRLVSATYGLTAAHVVTDAHDVATWHNSSEDDLLRLIDIRRSLGADECAGYLQLLRTALVVGAAAANHRLQIAGLSATRLAPFFEPGVRAELA